MHFFSILSLLIFCSDISLAQNKLEADKSMKCLSQIEQQTSKIKQCKVNQVLPGECDRYLQPSVLLTLQCAKSGAEKAQINAAILKGEKLISGNVMESPFKLIKKKIENSPFFISSEKDNYIPYSSQCSEYKDKLYRIAAMAIKDGQAKFIVSPVKPTTCLTKTNLNKKYPVLTPGQLEKFKQGYYLDKHPSAERPYENIEVMVADSMAEAGDFFARMKKRVKFTINTKPENADINIIGMKKSYKKGMKLNVGLYKVRISSPTYIPLELELKLEDENAVFNFELETSIEKVSCQENEQGFPIEFRNKYYLKKINNCTYHILSGSTSNTPFKLLVIKNNHPTKHLIKVKLGVMQFDQFGNMNSLAIEEVKPRLSKVTTGLSGISDVPASLSEERFIRTPDMKSRLTILDATFSF